MFITKNPQAGNYSLCICFVSDELKARIEALIQEERRFTIDESA